MRILQIIQKKQLRGAEIFASQLSNELLQLGHEVFMIALEEGDADLPFQPIITIRINKNKPIDIRSFKKIADYIYKVKPDIVQANASDTLKYAVWSKFFFRWSHPIVYRNANLISGFLTTLPKKLYYHWLFRFVSGVASVSSNCMDDFKRQFNWHTKPIAFLPIGLSLPLPVGYKGWKETGIQVDGKYVFINCAALMPEKNHAGLLRVFQQVKQEITDAELLIFGKGPLKQTLVEMRSQLGLQESVQILEPRRDIISILPLCKGLLMPSKIEGIPGIILESMASGIPIFATKVGGIPEVIEHGVTGWLSEPEAELEMSGQVLSYFKLFENASLTADAAQYVKLNFDNKKIGNLFAQFYQALLH